MKESFIMEKHPTARSGSIIGLPPSIDHDPVNRNALWTVASMPICRIWPQKASTLGESTGLHLFSLVDGIAEWRKIVKSASSESSSYSADGDSYLDIAYLNETSISETFNNEYGGSKFEEIGNITGGALSELRQITGGRNVKEVFGRLAEKTAEIPMIGGAVGAALETIGAIGGVGEAALQKTGLGLEKLLMGSKVDFPQIWKNASYSTNYSITCRLYNPVPLSKEQYKKRILEPLVKLLAFVVPQTDIDKDTGKSLLTYYIPLLCKVKCSGLWEIRAGFISSIEVIKGGEANDISFHQRPGMVDLRISFGELYGVMPSTVGSGYLDRPTLGRYIDILDQDAMKTMDSKIEWYKDADEVTEYLKPPEKWVTSSSEKLLSTSYPGMRVEMDKRKFAWKIRDETNHPGTRDSLDIIRDNVDDISDKATDRSSDSVGPNNLSSLLVGAAALGASLSISNNADSIVSNAKANRLVKKIATQVAIGSALVVARSSIRLAKTAVGCGGVKSLGRFFTQNKTITGASGIVYESMGSVGNVLSNMGKKTYSLTGKIIPNSLSNKIKGSSLGLISQSLRSGRMGRTGTLSKDLVRANANNTSSLYKGFTNISTAEGGSNIILTQLIEAILRLLLGFMIKRSINPGELIGLDPDPISGITYNDTVSSSTGLINSAISEMNISLMLSSSNSLKTVINSLCSDYASNLTLAVNKKIAHDNNPSNISLIAFKTAKTKLLNEIENIDIGFHGEICSAACLNDLCDSMDGNLQESADSGLMEAVADTYEEEVYILDNESIQMTQVYSDAVSAGADPEVTNEILNFIADIQEISTTYQDIADSLNANAEDLKA